MSSFSKVIKKFPKVFWIANIMELFERWAWYGFYNALALYLTLSKDTGALGFSQAQMGLIIGTGSMLLYFLPVITGAIADKIGFRKILMLSFFMYITGYFMMAYFESFYAVFASYLYIAVGGALFKPIIAGTVAKVTDEETSSIGFGIFYMMVNIGGWLGPLIAGVVYKVSWNYVFAMSMSAIAMNYIFVIFFFKEPIKKNGDTDLKGNIIQAFKNIGIALSDFKYLLFLIIMIGFWTAFNQLYYTFPVFLEQWSNTSSVYNGIHSFFPWLAETFGTKEGTISAISMTSFNAFFIILFQIVISTLVMKLKPLNAMIGGIFVLSIGVSLMFATQNGWFLMLGILIFAIGEMSSSPKFTEYIGRIAPSDKVALYIGTSYLPIAASHQIAGILAGSVYGKMGDKLFLLKTEILKRHLEIQEISDKFSQTDYYNKAAELMGFSNQQQLTDFLWTAYNPSRVWYVYAGIGFTTVIALILYDKFILKSPKLQKKSNI